MGIANPYQKNQPHGLIEHTRPRNDSPSHLDHIEGGAPNTGVWQHPLTHHQIIWCLGCNELLTALELRLSRVSLLDVTH
jgi:hypothetical protein